MSKQAHTPMPWGWEPDRVEWIDDATGLECLIKRGPSGALCGYVAVPADSPLQRLDYYTSGYSPEEVLCGQAAQKAPIAALLNDVEVHGGLTYAGRRLEVEDDPRWWFGFDCSHAGDFCPGHDKVSDPVLGLGRPTGWGGVIEYRDIAYVTGQVTALAEQLAAIVKATGVA